MKVIILSPAKEELAESALFYLEESSKAAFDFEETIEEAVASIAEAPLRYPVHAGDIRVKVVDRFPFSIFYRVKANEIHILSIAHNARRTNFWLNRSD